MKENNMSNLAPKRTDFEKIKKFEKWIEKKMCNAYEIIIN